jgi:hypothetical protein
LVVVELLQQIPAHKEAVAALLILQLPAAALEVLELLVQEVQEAEPVGKVELLRVLELQDKVLPVEMLLLTTEMLSTLVEEAVVSLTLVEMETDIFKAVTAEMAQTTLLTLR